MPFDGLFIHYLINEIKPEVVHKRINKLLTISDKDFAFVFKKSFSLVISIDPNCAHFRITKSDIVSSNTSLTPFIKKHLEGGIITDIKQYNCDRIVIFEILSSDELGYQNNYKMIFEFTGKNSNLIITDANYLIMEASKKSYLSDEHFIQIKAPYLFLQSNKVNPFLATSTNNLEGISKQTQSEIDEYGLSVIKREKNPVMIVADDKSYFYCFDLTVLNGTRKFFSTLSELLEFYFSSKMEERILSSDKKRAFNHIKHEIDKLTLKLEKQNSELNLALNSKDLEQKAVLLASNIHNVKPYQSSIIVKDFYNNNEDIEITLNTNISVNENINYYYNKVKKNKRAITFLTEQIKNTKVDISYYNELLSQLDYLSTSDLKEVMVEVGIKKQVLKNQKPHITKYITKDNSIIFVGKNNIQNNYLTHTLAASDDLFFHVKNLPGSHVILRGEKTKENIFLASSIAAYFSKARNGRNVCVDYTLVKWVKKVKGMKGSFVTYTNEKNSFANPDIDFINENATCK